MAHVLEEIGMSTYRSEEERRAGITREEHENTYSLHRVFVSLARVLVEPWLHVRRDIVVVCGRCTLRLVAS